MAQATLEYIHGMPVVKSYRQVDAAVSAARSAYARSRNVNLKTELAFQPFNALLLFVTRSASIGVIVIVCISFLNGTISLLNFCTLMMFSFMLFQSIEACGDAAYVIGHIGEVIDRLDAIESAPAIDDNCKAVKLEHHNLEMHDVSFAYGDGPLVLNGMSLTIPEGTTAALVGGSGSGKTTLLEHIRKQGEGILLSPKVSFQVYQQKGYQMTSEESIIRFVMRQTEFSESLVRSLLNHLGFAQETLTKPLCTLSGGEATRLTIALLFTKPSNVLLLDEPTNFIDMATIEALEKLMQIYPGTILFTSHDSYFVERTADEVYEIKGQKIKKVLTRNF